MKNIIIISLGLMALLTTGCVTKDTDTKNQVKKMQNSSTKKSKIKLPQSKKQKNIEDYKTVVRENIKRNKNQKEASENFENKKSKFLKEMEIARIDFTKTNDREKYMKIKGKIIQKLKIAQLKLDKEIKKNEIVNYRNEKIINNL